MRDGPIMTFLKMPGGLDEKGQLAYNTIMAFLRKTEHLNTGGCKAFYSPAAWRKRGEDYGRDSKLIVVYDGGDLGPVFSLDHAYPTYTLHTAMTEELAKIGLFAEECCGWYSAVYER